MPSVINHPSLFGHLPVSHRHVQRISIEDFCILLEHGGFQAKSELNDITMLHYPRAIATRVGTECTVVSHSGVSMDAYIADALAALDARELAA